MKKLVAFESLKEHYVADACVVWCYDDRFYKLLKAFGKQEGWKNIDLVKVAGGAKDLAVGTEASPSVMAARDFLLGQITTSIRLHGTKRVVLMTHRDCGAYGGSKSFTAAAIAGGEGVDAELVQHEAQLKAAKDFVASQISAGGSVVTIPVDAYFADFDGLYILS